MSLVGPGQLVPYWVNSALNRSYPPQKSSRLQLNCRYFSTMENCHVLCIGTRIFPADLTLKIRCVLCASARNTLQSTVVTFSKML